MGDVEICSSEFCWLGVFARYESRRVPIGFSQKYDFPVRFDQFTEIGVPLFSSKQVEHHWGNSIRLWVLEFSDMNGMKKPSATWLLTIQTYLNPPTNSCAYVQNHCKTISAILRSVLQCSRKRVTTNVSCFNRPSASRLITPYQSNPTDSRFFQA